MKKPIYSIDGNEIGEIELRDDIFAIEPNDNAMHQTVIAYLAHQRQGTRKTKTRAEVSGGGKKPWRQKGRGTARAGSTRSPLWVGGGTIHGPQPHKFNIKINRSVRRLAKKSALSLRVAEDNFIIVDDFKLNEIKTKDAFKILTNLKLDYEKTLVLLPEHNEVLYLSLRNIAGISVQQANHISAYDILNNKKILVLKSAINTIVTSILGEDAGDKTPYIYETNIVEKNVYNTDAEEAEIENDSIIEIKNNEQEN